MRKLKEETSQKQGFGKQCQANFKALRGLKDSNTYPKEILKNDKWKVTGSGSDMSPIWWALCIHHSCLGILCRLYPFLFALGYPWHSAISRRTSWGTAGCLGCLETRGDDLLQRLFNGKQKIYWVLLKLQWEPKLGISIFSRTNLQSCQGQLLSPFCKLPQQQLSTSCESPCTTWLCCLLVEWWEDCSHRTCSDQILSRSFGWQKLFLFQVVLLKLHFEW